ncbi:MAG: hypothetical protein V4724_41830 [Pseudomonadota bacterium]
MAAYHDRPLDEVCRRGQGGVSPYLSYSPETRFFPGGRAALRTMGDGKRIVDVETCEQLLSALASLNLASAAAVRKANSITIGAFRDYTDMARLNFINELWDEIATPYYFDTPASHMYTPPNRAPAGSEALPSSWCPTPQNRTTYHMRTAGTGRPDPWMSLSVGFRVDGMKDESAIRVRAHGMTQQSLNTAFMRNTRGLVLEGTTAANKERPRFWTGNNDIWNETAVCVSRNFFGGTAFPERETYNEQNGFALLWAVDCRGLVGFDTEAVQLQLPGARHWRPGEKAFQEIRPDRLLGCVKIRKMGAPATGGWTFYIDEEAAWELSPNKSVDQIDYIKAELDAWRGCHHIRPAFDFAA